MKKIFAFLILSLLPVLMFAKPAAKVLNIYTWNEEFPSRLIEFYPGYDKERNMIGDVKIVYNIISSVDNKYLNELFKALGQETVDIFCVEPAYASYFVESGFTMDMKNLGIKDSDLKNQFQFVKDYMTSSNGELKGLSWLSCPGGVIYRRSIAKKVLGTDDPDQVQRAISTWEKFDNVAAMAKSKGYYMVSGCEDNLRVFDDNRKTPWIVDGKINIDDSIYQWIVQQKKYAENGYSKNIGMWTAEYFDGGKKDGDVMCYFGPDWFLNWSLAPNAEETYGDWGFCKGPAGFNWGGNALCVAPETKHKALVKDILLTLTTNKNVMTKIADEAMDIVNNEEVLKSATKKSTFNNPFLGGQNPIKYYIESAKSLDLSNTSLQDDFFKEVLVDAMKDYFDGLVDEKTAFYNFYDIVFENYPELFEIDE